MIALKGRGASANPANRFERLHFEPSEPACADDPAPTTELYRDRSRSVLAENDVWLIDGRDLDPLERAALDASAVRRTGMAGLASLTIDGPVWVHLDIDVLDAEEAPAMNYPVPDGPSVATTGAACRVFAEANRIVAVSLSGWNGALDSDGRTAAATQTTRVGVMVRMTLQLLRCPGSRRS